METPFPETMPVMVLPEVCLFPNSLLPLYIFEPRYREMLEYALENDRMFAMAMPLDDLEGNVREVAGAGLVRACVKNKDGTSNLILLGMQRMRFTGWAQMNPFRIAEVEALYSEEKLAPKTASLMAQIEKICLKLQAGGVEFPKEFDRYLHEMPDADVFSDATSSVLIRNPAHRQILLEELNVTERMEKLIELLGQEYAE